MTARNDAHDARDLTLVARMAGGDARALGALYDLYGPVLRSIARRIVGPLDADDVLHDTFVNAWSRAAAFDGARGSVVAWLVWMTRNGAIDRLRRTARHAKSSASLVAIEATGQQHDHGGAPDAMRVSELLATLRTEQRTVLELAFFDGLSYPEIAAREGLPLGTVKSRVARGLEGLRLALTRPARRRPSPADLPAPP